MKITERKNEIVFKHGDRKLFDSSKLVSILGKIGSKNANIAIDVISTEVPLPLCKNAMKMVKVKIDFDNDVIHNSGQDIDILLTISGHYFIPICCTNKAMKNIIKRNSKEHILLILQTYRLNQEEKT